LHSAMALLWARRWIAMACGRAAMRLLPMGLWLRAVKLGWSTSIRLTPIRQQPWSRPCRRRMTKIGQPGAVASGMSSGCAAVPGRKAPVLVTKEMVEKMLPGSVIVDIAAERGGNCELTRPGETVIHNGVSIVGPLNLPSMVPYHASQMYSCNIAAFLRLLVKDGALNVNLEDEIIRETLVAHGGKIVNARVSELAAEQAAKV